MRDLAEMTAESLRSATGAYVFELRDRFDAALPTTLFGVGEHTWRALPSGEAPIDETELDLVDQLVFHPGDRLRCTLRFVCNQAPIRRTMRSNTDVASKDSVLCVSSTRFQASLTESIGSRFEAGQDQSVFVEINVDLAIGDLSVGVFDAVLHGAFTCTDRRPEGAIAEIRWVGRLRGIVVPDEDGTGVDCLSAEVEIDSERRSYWLDKASSMELTLPRPPQVRSTTTATRNDQD